MFGGEDMRLGEKENIGFLCTAGKQKTCGICLIFKMIQEVTTALNKHLRDSLHKEK